MVVKEAPNDWSDMVKFRTAMEKTYQRKQPEPAFIAKRPHLARLVLMLGDDFNSLGTSFIRCQTQLASQRYEQSNAKRWWYACKTQASVQDSTG
mmetsp:Transcript_64405/g.151315  ORF Transcript_64405/g.151315 Transcript_64405/m.151315 type:complete len:94 (-) Transcript_64405:113-394(-)